MRTTPLYLMALIIAIANTPLPIYQVCAWNMGTVHAEPWRSKLTDSAPVRRVVEMASRFREWCAELAAVPLVASEVGEAALDLLVPGGTQLKALREKAGQIHGRLKALNAKAIAAASVADAPPLTQAERDEVATFKAQFDDVRGILAEAERLNEEERNFRIVRPDPDAVAEEAARKLAAGKDKDKFSSFGERMQAVYRAALPGNRTDPRLMAIAPGMNESNPADGGFLVGQEQVTTFRQRMYETGQILSRVFNLPIGADKNGVKLMAIDETSRADGSRYGGITSYWLDEGGTKTASKPKWRPMELSLKKVAALVRVTDELLQDATALEAWIMRFLPLELKFKAEDAIVSGTGAGMPLGFLNSGATISVTRTTPGTISYEDIVNMWSRFYAPSRSNAGAAWFVDQSAEPALFSMSLQIGAGGIPVYLPANGIVNKPFSTLFGLPVIPAEYLSAVGTKGDIMLADLSNYTFIDKGDVQSASSIHVYFVTDETAFRFVYRCDGQMEWSAPLTPKNGGPTVGPVVVLST